MSTFNSADIAAFNGGVWVFCEQRQGLSLIHISLPEVSGTCLTQTMIFISICLLSYFTPIAREMTMRWTSEVPS